MQETVSFILKVKKKLKKITVFLLSAFSFLWLLASYAKLISRIMMCALYKVFRVIFTRFFNFEKYSKKNSSNYIFREVYYRIIILLAKVSIYIKY